jgi:HD superfamily phosphohydrolase
MFRRLLSSLTTSINVCPLTPEEQFRAEAQALKAQRAEFSEFQQTLERYQNQGRSSSNSADDLLPILRRYNLTWESTAALQFPQFPGFVRFFPSKRALNIVAPLLSQAFFYRLNFIRQLSTVHLWQNLEAGHSRLAHSLGVVQCAELFLDSINRKDPKLIEEWERRAVLIYAFIHDAFHGPMGHSLELMRTVFTTGTLSSGKLDKTFLAAALADSSSPLCRALNTVLASDSKKDDILAYLRFFCGRGLPNPSMATKYFLKEIVDSQVDADRLDYIFRDCHHLGIPLQFSPNDIYDLIENAKVCRYTDPKSKSERHHLAFFNGDEPSIRQVLSARQHLYTHIYDHPHKLILDEMICHSLYYILKARGVLPLVLPGAETSLFSAQSRVIAELSHLTDGDLWHFLYEAGGPLFAQLMIRDVLTNNSFAEIMSSTVVDESALHSGKQFEKAFEEVVSNAKKWSNAFEAELEKVKRRRAEKEGTRSDMLPTSDADRLEAGTKALKRCSADAALFQFIHTTWLGGFAARNTVEKLFWQFLLKESDIRSAAEAYFVDRFGPLERNILDELMSFPLVHISIPPYVVTRAKESWEYAKEVGAEPILLYDSQGKCEEMRRGESVPSPNMVSVMLSGPRRFCLGEIRKRISERFRAMVVSSMWLDRQLLDQVN